MKKLLLYCFRDGKMTSGELFCIRGKKYEYSLPKNHNSNDYYNVKSEVSKTHSMPGDFIRKYYNFHVEFFSDEDFRI